MRDDDQMAAIRANHLAFVEVSTAAGALLDELARMDEEQSPGLDAKAVEAYDRLAALVGHQPWFI